MLRDTPACKSSTNYVYDFGGKNLVRIATAVKYDISGASIKPCGLSLIVGFWVKFAILL
jgi:hypothetical protein